MRSSRAVRSGQRNRLRHQNQADLAADRPVAHIYVGRRQDTLCRRGREPRRCGLAPTDGQGATDHRRRFYDKPFDGRDSLPRATGLRLLVFFSGGRFVVLCVEGQLRLRHDVLRRRVPHVPRPLRALTTGLSTLDLLAPLQNAVRGFFSSIPAPPAKAGFPYSAICALTTTGSFSATVVSGSLGTSTSRGPSAMVSVLVPSRTLSS